MKKYAKIFKTLAIIAGVSLTLVACGKADNDTSNPDNGTSSELQVDATKEAVDYAETTTTVPDTTVTTTATTTEAAETTATEAESTDDKSSGGNSSSVESVDYDKRREGADVRDDESVTTYIRMSTFAIEEKWSDLALESQDVSMDGMIEKYNLVPIEGEEATYTGLFNELGFSGNGYYTITHPLAKKTDTKSTKAYFMTNDANEVVAVAFKDLSDSGQVTVGDPDDGICIKYFNGMDVSGLNFAFDNNGTNYTADDGTFYRVYSDGYFSAVFIFGNGEQLSEEGEKLTDEDVAEIMIINNSNLTLNNEQMN